MPLKILIVGAGLAGLSTAIAIARKGHEVVIFEKSAFSNELGAALHFGPSTTAHVFKAWGLDMDAFQSCICLRWTTFSFCGDDIKPLAVRYELEERRMELGFEGDEIMCHRVDAHSYLREVALSFPNTHLLLSSGVGMVDTEAGSVTLRDGSIHTGDVIVGADGIHSKMVQAIAGPDCIPTRAGANIFRFLVDTKKAFRNKTVATYLESMEYLHSMVDLCSSKGPRAVMYPCRNGTLLNFGLIFPANLTNMCIETMDWRTPCRKEEVLSLYDDFPQVLKDLIEMGEDFKQWAFATRDSPNTFVKGKLVLVGDAAHPIHATHATGACQGVEDGACLGELLDETATADNIFERLALYNELRYERTTTLRYASEMGSQGGAKRLSNLRRFVPDGELPEDPDKFIWLYDPIKEARELLRKHRESSVSQRSYSSPRSILEGEKLYL